MTDAVLTLNAGSSSVKLGLFELSPGQPPRQIAHGSVDRGEETIFTARDASGEELPGRQWPTGEAPEDTALFGELLGWSREKLGSDRLVAVGHRVVHGGRQLTAPARITDAVLAELDGLVALAPLHQPHSLSAIRAVRVTSPDLPQIACFDTAFHRGHAAEVKNFALPRELTAQGIERYGFHGLSYEYISAVLPQTAPTLAQGRVVVAHLGNGASLCALRAGRSVDTTMGFSVLDGLVMGTRCGSLDPGVILYLQQTLGMSPQAIEDLLYRKSGLLGVSQISSDMRVLLNSADPHAIEAVELFTFRIARETCAMLAALGGLDGIVFTAGIGEHAPEIRRRVCAALAWLGVELDLTMNAKSEGCISRDGSRVAVWVIPTDEEAMIARHVADVLNTQVTAA